MKTLGKHSLIAARWMVPLALLGGLAWVVLRTNPEPVYQGKRLGEWLAGYHGQQSPETEEAVRRLGTNAIPTLLRMLRAKDSKATIWLMGLVRKQHLIKFEYHYDFQIDPEAAAKLGLRTNTLQRVGGGWGVLK